MCYILCMCSSVRAYASGAQGGKRGGAGGEPPMRGFGGSAPEFFFSGSGLHFSGPFFGHYI
jgi:hypothetical protein